MADYFKASGAVVSDPPFLDVVVIDFAVADVRAASINVPLLVSPFGSFHLSRQLTWQAVRFLLNGEVVEAEGVDPTRTLLEHLRGDLRRTGTKEGCAEGDCGSCTVLVGELEGQTVSWRAVNSCIQFVPMLDGKAVITRRGAGPGAERGTRPIRCRPPWSSTTARNAASARRASSCRCTAGPWRPRAADAPIDEVLAGNLVPLHRLWPDHRGGRGDRHPRPRPTWPISWRRCGARRR